MERELYAKVRQATAAERKKGLAKLRELQDAKADSVEELARAVKRAEAPLKALKDRLKAAQSEEHELRQRIIDGRNQESVWLLKDGTLTAEGPDSQMTFDDGDQDEDAGGGDDDDET